MDTKGNYYLKTLGPKEAHFIIGLYEVNKGIFSLQIASEVSGLSGQSLQNLLYRLVRKGILSRLGGKLYTIVPFHLGHTREYLNNPYLVAREIALNTKKRNKYYISHGSAMSIHQMITQPQFVTYTSVTQQIKKKSYHYGIKVSFCNYAKVTLFWVEKHWIEASETIFVSDIEKTIIDGLKLPQYCGGITEVAKGLWIKRNEININKLVKYAFKVNMGVVFRRLGFLLDIYQLAEESFFKEVKK